MRIRMRNNIYCPHYRKHSADYIYELVGCTLWVCEGCNKKLMKQFKQKMKEAEDGKTTN